MTWKRTATVPMQQVSYEALAATGVLVFRGTQSVFGWRKDTSEPAWTHALPDDETFGMKHLFSAAGAVVTLRQTPPGHPKHLVWLEPTTGTLQQEHAYAFEPSQDGFTAAGDFLFLHGNLPNGSGRLLRLAADTGSILETADAPLGQQLLASPRRLYLNQGPYGLSHTPLDTARWAHADVGAISEVTPWREQLFFFQVPEDSQVGWELVWWHADEARALGRMRTEATTGLIVLPSPQEGVVAAYEMESGLWLLDLPAGVCRWKLPLTPGERLMSACWTPHGLVTAIEPEDQPARLEHRDAASGEVLETLPNTIFDTATLYWLEDRLIASGIEGLESFAWEG